tara:strand:- start:1790 stop:1900 length:111 start_codon:yes stop_codon:yes gene_type:complete
MEVFSMTPEIFAHLVIGVFALGVPLLIWILWYYTHD